MSNLYDVLEVCLQEIDQGAEIESVLARYPNLADELRPILEAAVQAKSIAVHEPPSEVVRRNRAKVLQQAAEMRESISQPSRRIWSVPLRRALVTLFVVIALFIGSTNLVRAASTTLPGDNLYPVKRTWENVQVLFTFNMQAREALEMEHENERLEELYEVFAEGRSEEVDFAGVVTSQNGDLWMISTIPVVLSTQTDLHDGPVAVGDEVRVRGLTQLDGSVLAERIDILEEGVSLPELDNSNEHDDSENENDSDDDHSGPGSGDETSDPEETDDSGSNSDRRDVSIEGVVDSVNGSTLIINGLTMDISNAEVRGTPTVGVSVKVEGYYDANGNFIVTKLEFREDNSGSDDDSGGNDNDNGDNDNSNDDNGDEDNSNDENDADDNGNDNDDDEDDDNSGPGGGGDDGSSGGDDDNDDNSGED